MDIEARKNDWRNSQIVYQIFVDRFERGQDFSTKSRLYDSPRRLRNWSEKPGAEKEFLEDPGCWKHELEFWGGDLPGVTARLSYLRSLGINTIYLNPIFHAFTNHKYDTIDYFSVDSQFGSLSDLKLLVDNTHHNDLKIRVVLDGVFNHVGAKNTWFQEVLKSSDSPYRSFFFFGPQYRFGYRAWANVKNLPELNLENPEVQKKIFRDSDSVVRRYLEFVDGWRLDVAFELGPEFLRQITDSAHQARTQSLVIGEIWNYPDGWLQAMDGVLNFYLRRIILETVKGGISPGKAGRLIDRMIKDCGLESLIKSWTILSNHDTPRLKVLLPDPELRKLALILQFTLPGAPVIYYGEELGMSGGDDPANRGAMEWERLRDDNPDLKFYRQLITLRNSFPALQYGNFVHIEAEKLLCFCRTTQRIKDMVLVAVNPGDQAVTEIISIPEYRLMNGEKLQSWDREGPAVTILCGMVTLEMPPRSFCIFTAVAEGKAEYTPYKRVLDLSPG